MPVALLLTLTYYFFLLVNFNGINAGDCLKVDPSPRDESTILGSLLSICGDICFDTALFVYVLCDS